MSASLTRWLRVSCILALTWVSGLVQARDWEPGFRDLANWGRGLQLRPITSGEELLLTNRWTRMRFRKDSDRMSFNEVEFRLSDRISVEGGHFRVSQRDIDSLMAPLLTPPKRTSRPIKRIAINAGHGGRDPGNMEGRRMEKNYTLDLAIDLARHLKASGFRWCSSVARIGSSPFRIGRRRPTAQTPTCMSACISMDSMGPEMTRCKASKPIA